MNIIGMIDVTKASLAGLVQAAYSLSKPQGLGILHYEEGDLTSAEVVEIISRRHGSCAVNMDYVNGRACKFNVKVKENRYYVRNVWHDHSDHQFKILLEAVGLSGGLIETAREEQKNHEKLCEKVALDFLANIGGKYEEPESYDPEGDISEKVIEGLWVGLGRGTIDRTPLLEKTIWEIIT